MKVGRGEPSVSNPVHSKVEAVPKGNERQVLQVRDPAKEQPLPRRPHSGCSETATRLSHRPHFHSAPPPPAESRFRNRGRRQTGGLGSHQTKRARRPGQPSERARREMARHRDPRRAEHRTPSAPAPATAAVPARCGQPLGRQRTGGRSPLPTPPVRAGPLAASLRSLFGGRTARKHVQLEAREKHEVWQHQKKDESENQRAPWPTGP